MVKMIRKAALADVPAIVAIHKLSFPGFFLTSLGDRFLQLYYKCMCRSKDAITLCAIEEDRVIGFASCAYVSHGFNKALVRSNLIEFVVVGFRLLITNPKTIIRLLKNMEKGSSDTSISDSGNYAELYSIAVSPEYQGHGVGKELLRAVELEVTKHNNAISLTTDFYENEKTIAFYHSLGYNELYDFDAYPNRRMWRMIKSLG